MPRRFLNQAERERLSQFPADIADDTCTACRRKCELAVYFTLTPTDMEAIELLRVPHMRLGFALLVGTLRYLGFFPVNLTEVPEAVLKYLADQVSVPVESMTAYWDWPENRRRHIGQVMAHLGFRRPEEADLSALAAWLVDRALQNERPSHLLQLACERLYQNRLVRPGLTRLEEMIAEVRQQAWQVTVTALVGPLSEADKQQLAEILQPMPGTGVTPLSWLRRSAEGYSARDILDTLAKLAYVRQWPLLDWKLGPLPRSRHQFLARLARHNSNQGLQRRQPATQRQAILVAFLLWTHETLIDEVVDLFDRCLADLLRKSQRDLREYHLAHRTQLDQLVTYFEAITDVLVDSEVEDDAVRAAIYRRIPEAELRIALALTRQMRVGGRAINELDFFDRRYSYLRHAERAPQFLAALTFQSQDADDDLLTAVTLLRNLNAQDKPSPTRLSNDVPVGFLPRRWQVRIFDSTGDVKRRAYEQGVLLVLRDALRSGQIWVEDSRRYAPVERYLIPEAQWADLRATYSDLVGVPTDGTTYLTAKQEELETRLARFDAALPKAAGVRLERAAGNLSAGAGRTC